MRYQRQRSIKSTRYLEPIAPRRTERPVRGAVKAPQKPAGPIVLLVQSAAVLLLVGALFTMQFVQPQRYEQAGEYYRQVMTGAPTEDSMVQTLAMPLNMESINTLLKDWSAEKVLEVFRVQQDESVAAQGGMEENFPRNASYTRVVFSAAARSPLPCDAAVTSGYGVRTNPVTGKWDFHTGIDLAAPYGTDIGAVFPGTVREVGESASYGIYIVVEHSTHLATVYCHCSSICAAVGERVKAGQTVAAVGSTGISTGAHLHLSVLLDGCYVDPMNLYRA